MRKCWFGHVWRLERRATPGGMSKAVIFTLRACTKCSAIEILNAGMIGDQKWSPFRGNLSLNKAEQEWFETATAENYLHLDF